MCIDLRKLFDRENISEILAFSGPVFVEQATIVVMALITSVLISNLGAAQISGVNLVETLNNLVQQVFLSIGLGVTVVVAQLRGKGDNDLTGEAASQGILSALALAVLMLLMFFLFSKQILGLIMGDAEPAIYESGYTYLMCSALSYPFLAIYFTCGAAIRGSGYPRISLISTVITNVLYALLAFIFIRGMGMGVLGAGIALIICRAVGCGVGVYLLKAGTPALHLTRVFPKRVNWQLQRPLLLIGIPSCIENVLFLGGRLATQTYAIPFGTSAMAVNSISNSISNLINLPGATASAAIVPVVGKCVGENDTKKARGMTILFLLLLTGTQIVVSAAMYLFAAPIAGVFSDDLEIIKGIVLITSTAYLAQALIWPASFILPAAMRSAGDVRYTTVVSTVSMLGLRITFGYLLSHVMGLGVLGIWLGMYIDWAFRGILFAIRYRGDKWLSKKVV